MGFDTKKAAEELKSKPLDQIKYLLELIKKLKEKK